MPPPSAAHEIIAKSWAIVGILEMPNSLNVAILEMIYIPLGLLGIFEGAGAAAIGSSRNHWKNIGNHRHFGDAIFLGFPDLRDH